MGQPTQRYKKTMSGSVGAGMKSLFGSNGRRFFVLEHKVSSKYHRAGEEQQIIVDQVEIGRDSKCAVRLVGHRPDDPMFSIVSRRHAAIQKEGDNWVLVHLSKTNSTFLNGKKFSHTGQKWYLQNGDEIQIAENGPKLCFKTPIGDKGLVKSIGLSTRMSLFRQQALRPYRTAIVCLACVLVLASCVGGYIIHDQGLIISKQGEEILSLNNRLTTQSEDFNQQLAAERERRAQDSIENVRRSAEDRERYSRDIAAERRRTASAIAAAEERLRRQGGENANLTGISAMLEQQQVFKDVYFLFTQKVVLVNGNSETIIKKEDGSNFGWCGTGFLLNDGKFVTARHCIEGWWYQDGTANTMPAQAARVAATNSGYHIKGYYIAVSSLTHNKFEFTSDDFTMNHSLDKKAQIGTDESGNPLYWNFTFPVNPDWDRKMWATDWAYTTRTNGKRGNLESDSQLSRNLLPMQDLVVLGFPENLGVNDGENAVEPITNSVSTSRRGLAANGCIMHSRGTDHGNSGGPIFAIKDGKLVVVGIVSRGDVRSTEYNWAVPISNIR